MVTQFLINGIILGSVYSLVSLGFALVYNTTRTFHLAYATLYMFCPYMIYTLNQSFQIPFVLAFIIGCILTMLLSVIMEIAVYRPLQKNRSSLNVFMVSSIGIMIVVINIIAMIYGNETKILNPEISQSISFGSVIITYSQMLQFGLCTSMMGAFLILLKYSKLGIMMRAMRDDDELCSVLGLKILKFRIVLFAISGLFAAIAGGIVAYDVGMDPYVGMPMLLNAVVALIIGGVGSFKAPVLGGFIIGLLQALSVYVFSARWQDAVTFILLLLFLLLRPNGILGEKRRVV